MVQPVQRRAVGAVGDVADECGQPPGTVRPRPILARRRRSLGGGGLLGGGSGTWPGRPPLSAHDSPPPSCRTVRTIRPSALVRISRRAGRASRAARITGTGRQQREARTTGSTNAPVWAGDESAELSGPPAARGWTA